MSPYVEAGYLVVTSVLGGYSIALASKAKRLKHSRVPVRVPVPKDVPRGKEMGDKP